MYSFALFSQDHVAKQKGDGAVSRYDYVWTLEDDIFFTGDLGDYFDYYSSTDADLITVLFKVC